MHLSEIVFFLCEALENQALSRAPPGGASPPAFLEECFGERAVFFASDEVSYEGGGELMRCVADLQSEMALLLGEQGGAIASAFRALQKKIARALLAKIALAMEREVRRMEAVREQSVFDAAARPAEVCSAEEMVPCVSLFDGADGMPLFVRRFSQRLLLEARQWIAATESAG